MSIFVLIGIVLLILAKRLISKLEYETIEYTDSFYHRNMVWKDIKFPLWAWILAFCLLCIPIMGILLYIAMHIIVIAEIKCGDIRFKEGKESLLVKLIDYLNKEY